MDASRRIVVLDRDGTLIVDKHYLADPGAVELVEGTGAALELPGQLHARVPRFA
jgi:D-glycero-D-manno-heptose 1,7-bisphosphate phosphatase